MVKEKQIPLCMDFTFQEVSMDSFDRRIFLERGTGIYNLPQHCLITSESWLEWRVNSQGQYTTIKSAVKLVPCSYLVQSTDDRVGW